MGFDLNLEGSCLACISNLDGRYLGKLLLCVASWQCVMTRKTRCCQEGHGTRGLFLGGGNRGGERHHRAPPLLSSASVSKKQDGTPRRRWRTGGEMSSWHTLACVRKIAHHVRAWQRSFCRRGFDLTGWQRCKWSFPAPFFFFFPTLFLHESQRLAGKSCLSIHGCKTRMPGPVFGRVDGLVIDTFLWLNWQRTCKQIDEVKVNTSEIWEVWRKRASRRSTPSRALSSGNFWSYSNQLSLPPIF